MLISTRAQHGRIELSHRFIGKPPAALQLCKLQHGAAASCKKRRGERSLRFKIQVAGRSRSTSSERQFFPRSAAAAGVQLRALTYKETRKRRIAGGKRRRRHKPGREQLRDRFAAKRQPFAAENN